MCDWIKFSISVTQQKNSRTFCFEERRIKMDIIPTCFSCLIIFGFLNSGVFGITLTDTQTPSGTLILGNNAFTLLCRYSLNQGEEMYASSLKRKREGETDFTSIVEFPGPASAVEATILDTTLTSRINVTKPTADNSLTAIVEFKDVECSDKAEYKWFVTFYDGGIQTSETTFRINNIKSLSTFRDDGTLTYTPSVNLHENDMVTFTCTGDVGAEPVGSLAWYLYMNDATSGGQDVSAQAVAQTPVVGDHPCTFKRTSRLELKMTAALNGVSVRCTAQQDVRNEFGDQNNNYNQTNRLDVTYGPRPAQISLSSPASNGFYPAGHEDLTLTCTSSANPRPSFYWVLPENSTEDTHMPGSILRLGNLTEEMSGTYTCVVYNTINNVNYTVNVSETFIVQKTTTTTSTTTPIPTTEPGTDGGGDNSGQTGTTDDDGDDTSTTVIIVVVVLAVVLVIVVVVIIIVLKMRKKKEHIEEPPEKPIRNNQDLSYFSNRPDLVSGDQGLKNNALNSSFNNSFDSSSDMKPRNDDGLNYVDLAFDDKPRSRRPIQLYDNTNIPYDNTNVPYADIAMPRV